MKGNSPSSYMCFASSLVDIVVCGAICSALCTQFCRVLYILGVLRPHKCNVKYDVAPERAIQFWNCYFVPRISLVGTSRELLYSTISDDRADHSTIVSLLLAYICWPIYVGLSYTVLYTVGLYPVL